MSGSILITIGLGLDIVGVLILASGVIMDADKAQATRIDAVERQQGA